MFNIGFNNIWIALSWILLVQFGRLCICIALSWICNINVSVSLGAGYINAVGGFSSLQQHIWNAISWICRTKMVLKNFIFITNNYCNMILIIGSQQKHFISTTRCMNSHHNIDNYKYFQVNFIHFHLVVQGWLSAKWTFMNIR